MGRDGNMFPQEVAFQDSPSKAPRDSAALQEPPSVHGAGAIVPQTPARPWSSVGTASSSEAGRLSSVVPATPARPSGGSAPMTPAALAAEAAARLAQHREARLNRSGAVTGQQAQDKTAGSHAVSRPQPMTPAAITAKASGAPSLRPQVKLPFSGAFDR